MGGFQWFVSFLTGYVVLLIRGAHLEKMLNLLTNSGLLLWDIRRLSPEAVQIKMRAHGYLRIREFVHRTHSIVRIHQKKGWPFLWRRLKQRKMLIIGGAAFILCLFYLSSFIFFVKVQGLAGEERRQLLMYLANLGLRPGVSRQKIVAQRIFIEREVMIHNPRAVWLGITIRGVVAEVNVVKRKTVPNSIRVCDIIAAKDGVISKLVTVRGMPVVKEGDSVAKGDLLISGVEWFKNSGADEMLKREVPASGIVEARVWYDLEVIEPKIIWRSQFTGTSYAAYKLRWGRKIWNIAGFGKKPRGSYTWTRWRRPIYQGRNPFNIVELIKDTWQLTTWHRVVRNPQELEQAALDHLNQKKKSMKDITVISQTKTWSDEDNFLKLTVTYEAIEDIAMISVDGKEY